MVPLVPIWLGVLNITLDGDVCLLRLFGFSKFREITFPVELLYMKAGVPWQRLTAHLLRSYPDIS